MNLLIADTFTDSLARLAAQEQKATKTTAFDLQVDPTAPGMSFHKLDGAKDPNFWSVRVSADLRIIVHRTASSLLLAYVGHHDAAYAWAERRKIERHPTTGSIQIVEVRERVEEIVIPAPKPSAPAKPKLFANLRKGELMAFGVPEEWVDDVRAADEDLLLDVISHLPQEAQEALLKLAVGEKPERAEPTFAARAALYIQESEAPRRRPVLHPIASAQSDEGDWAAPPFSGDPFQHPNSLRRSDVEALRRALDEPWEKWAVFLHPSQAALVARDFSGPARVTGSAGTGKTIVALHRAAHLARSHAGARVLLTTFSDALAHLLERRLRTLTSGEPDVAARVVVKAIGRVGVDLYAEAFGAPNVPSPETIRALIAQAAGKRAGLKFSLPFLYSEWFEIIDPLLVGSPEDYGRVSRLGRKTRLAASQRDALWPIFRDVREALKALAGMPIPLTFKPGRGSASALERVREQARIQVEGKAAGVVLYERLQPVPGFGLARLYEPSPGDIFFDFEGDPFVGEGGLEYLFGYSFRGEDGQERYVGDWALSRAEERAAFERFIDFVIDRLNVYPDLHIYHFAPYEPAALKRLMGRYATREDELDQLLRGKRFVDLFAVVRQGLRASVESYSIKRLEPLYGYVRDTSLPDANQALAKLQAFLELGDASDIGDDERGVVEAYNRDDCRSTWRLRDWLEIVRASAIAEGENIERPDLSEAVASEELNERQLKIAALVDRLTLEVPDDPSERTSEQHARWILAHSLDWHRREKKVSWWEYFRLCDLPAEDLLDERAGLGGLVFVAEVDGTGKTPVHRYRFPPQETELRGEEDVRANGGAKLGSVMDISIGDGWVDIKKRRDSADLHPEALFAHNDVDTTVLADALLRIGEYVADHGLEGEGPYQPARDLLMRHAPRVGSQPLRVEGETAVEAALRLALSLDGGVLPIQGPPGSGKTYTGARMIAAIANAGLRVGVTANSHKVIRNLLDEVCRAADEIGVDLTCIQKVPDKAADEPRLQFTTDNAVCFSALQSDCQVAGGTAWLWARPDARDAVDVLFVDEAAQMSLANVLAVSQAAKTIVLLGDPQQLDQPTQGSHPEGVDTSALDHILDGHQTIPEDRGLFLEETWRLHPTICAFTSELFYEDRLRPRPGLELQEIRSTGPLHGSGLRYRPVVHSGNQSSSPEEAEVVRSLVTDVLASTPDLDQPGGT